MLRIALVEHREKVDQHQLADPRGVGHRATPPDAPSNAWRKNAIAWAIAARVALVWLSALRFMKSWQMPS
jgi:hypothetical protein